MVPDRLPMARALVVIVPAVCVRASEVRRGILHVRG